MKTIIVILISIFSSFIDPADPLPLKIYTGNNEQVELRHFSELKENHTAKIIIKNVAGEIISTQTTELLCGNNVICLCDALALPEGEYRVNMIVKNTTYSGRFIIWQ